MPRGVYERSQATKDRVAALAQKNKENPEWIRKQSESHTGKTDSEETLERKRQSQLKRYEDPKEHQKTIDSVKGVLKKSTENYHKPKSDLHKQHISESLTDRPSTPEWNKKNSENRTGKCMGNINRLDTIQTIATRKKISEALKNNKHAWKGGVTPLHLSIRTLPQYLEWVKNVMKRDGYVDAYTDGKGNLEVHHRIPFGLILLYRICWVVHHTLIYY
jgi:hypothetical protein